MHFPKTEKTAVRAEAVLTTSYVNGTIIDEVENYNQLDLYCYFTLGSLTSVEIRVESSLDNTNFVQETNLSISGATGTLTKGEYTITTGGNFKISLPISAHYVRVAAKGTGTVTDSLLQIDGFLSRM